MGFFQSKKDVQEVLGGFFRMLMADEKMGPKLLASNLTLRFNYRKPETAITVDLSGDRLQLYYDDYTSSADIEMSMDAETAHQFWLGEVNLPMALARRQMTAKGPIPKILKLLPIITNAYALYPRYLHDLGRDPAHAE